MHAASTAGTLGQPLCDIAIEEGIQDVEAVSEGDPFTDDVREAEDESEGGEESNGDEEDNISDDYEESEPEKLYTNPGSDVDEDDEGMNGAIVDMQNAVSGESQGSGGGSGAPLSSHHIPSVSPQCVDTTPSSSISRSTMPDQTKIGIGQSNSTPVIGSLVTTSDQCSVCGKLGGICVLTRWGKWVHPKVRLPCKDKSKGGQAVPPHVEGNKVKKQQPKCVFTAPNPSTSSMPALTGTGTQQVGEIQNLEVHSEGKGKGKQRESAASFGEGKNLAPAGAYFFFDFWYIRFPSTNHPAASSSVSTIPQTNIITSSTGPLFGGPIHTEKRLEFTSTTNSAASSSAIAITEPQTTASPRPSTDPGTFSIVSPPDSNTRTTYRLFRPQPTPVSTAGGSFGGIPCAPKNMYTGLPQLVFEKKDESAPTTRTTRTANGTAFQPVKAWYLSPIYWKTYENNRDVMLRYQAISCMRSCFGTSFKELCVQDYQHDRKTPARYPSGQPAFGDNVLFGRNDRQQGTQSSLFGTRPAANAGFGAFSGPYRAFDGPNIGATGTSPVWTAGPSTLNPRLLALEEPQATLTTMPIRRPPLPFRHANEHIRAIVALGILPRVEYRVHSHQGNDVLIGSMKVKTPALTGCASIYRRYDTNAISLTGMYHAAFPNASGQEEKDEIRWVKETYNLTGMNRSSMDTAGKGVHAGEFDCCHVHARPSSSVSHRRSRRRQATPESLATGTFDDANATVGSVSTTTNAIPSISSTVHAPSTADSTASTSNRVSSSTGVGPIPSSARASPVSTERQRSS
ncbi:hypothetical protein PQX77_018016 [Marasmius sp. AFHP31]|nr:hypothetical protein PQX77_018016 [Marasmius sp. AFHP31]